jgi:hypothetical protein
MTSTKLLVVAALSLPVLLTACSSSDPSTVGPPPSPTVSSTPTSPPPLVVASAYVVKASKTTSDADLKKALTVLAKIPGVVGVSLVGGHQLRVDLANTQLDAKRAEVLAVLRSLGSVSVPTT